MPSLISQIDRNHDEFKNTAQVSAELIAKLRALEARAAATSAKSEALFTKRGQLLPRQRLAQLLDSGAPWLELSSIAGFTCDTPDPDQSIPGAGVICGIGFVSHTRVMIVVNDAGIDAGAIQSMGLEKILRAQELALQNKLPFIQLIESAGANLLKYKVENFVHGGKLFYNLARLSAAGLPVIGIVHGSSTAGGAYMPGLSDYVVMVKDRAKAFLAGPPLLKAATGEVATDEALGGATMHTQVSGLGEYLAQDDAHALQIVRELVTHLQWDRQPTQPIKVREFAAPRYPEDELLGAAPADFKKPFDMREVIARIVDDSNFLEFQADYGVTTLCGHASVHGIPIGIISNNGPIDPPGSHKVTHFIQACCQANIALVYLQNTTGYLVGTLSEQAGMIKHGSKMIQAVSNATVPAITIHCGASFGAGNYGMCGLGFAPRFSFSWPTAQTAVMGGEQAAKTMRIVAEATAARKNEVVDEVKMSALEQKIIQTFASQSSAFYTSARMLDDGIIDPRDTRKVLAFTLKTCLAAAARPLHAIQFGVARP
jgi:geranyl-CoA carboxylase beta subunit